jgi:hypothetical protein
MIKFFRHIRQTLIEQGKMGRPAGRTGRYFKYAIGEIVLVVIGILIALQINNWNQHRILRNQSQQVLLNLREEITESKAELKETTNFLKQRIDNRLEYLNHTNSDVSDAEKIKKIGNMMFFYTDNLKLPITESELGPDKKIIQWPELTKSLQNLYESIQYYNKGIEYIENDIHSNILPYSVKQGVIVDLMVSNGMLKSRDYLSADVYNSENFRNVIASSTLMTSGLLEGAKKVLDNYDEVLHIINKKLNTN